MKTCRELRDRVTVIRDGKYIETRDIDGWTNDSLISAMVGRTLDNLLGRTETMRAIFGADPIDGGKIYVHGKELCWVH